MRDRLIASYRANITAKLKIAYYEKENSNICHEYAIYFILWSEKKYISLVALPLMKYAFFASLDDINIIHSKNLNILYHVYPVIIFAVEY